MSAASAAFSPPGWLDDEPAFDCASVPTSVRALARALAGDSIGRRTGVLWLSPEAYAAGPQWAAHCLDLYPRHLGREVVAACEAQGTQRVPATAAALLRPIQATHTTGTWLWGLDGLLTRLPTTERQVFWAALFDLRQRPPLLLALPQAYRDFGPGDPERWLQAEPQRGLEA
jgi:hypothetical protein